MKSAHLGYYEDRHGDLRPIKKYRKTGLRRADKHTKALFSTKNELRSRK